MGSLEEMFVINNKLSDWNLIYSKSKQNFIVLWILALVSAVPFIISFRKVFLLRFDWLIILCVIGSLIALYYLGKTHSKKKEQIISEHYPYADGDTIFKNLIQIRKAELKRMVNNDQLFTKDNIKFIIESIQREHQSRRYTFPLLVNVITITAAILGTVYIESLINYCKNLHETIYILKTFFGIALALILTCWYFEQQMKDVILIFRRRKIRLIRVLENIYIEQL